MIKRAAEHHEVMAVIGKPKPEKHVKTKRNPPIDKYAILIHRSRLCDCGCGELGHDLHHAFIGRKAGHPELDDERNLVFVTHEEHIARKFDNREWRIKFWRRQLYRYGIFAMMDWFNSLPPKMQSRIDWL